MGAGSPERGDSASCSARPETRHPSYTSADLILEIRDRASDLAGFPMPPFEIEVMTASDVSSPVQMELTIHDPAGRTHVQRFTFVNMRQQCGPICDPVAGGPQCPPPRCGMERFRPPAQRIDPAIYRGSSPGTWTYVLHRLDTDDRVSVSRDLFEGPVLEDEACEAFPLELGGFSRTGCRRGVVPMGVTTSYWGLKAQYVRGGCRANAFVLPIDHQVRTLLDEGPYEAAPLRTFPEGTVHEAHVGGVTAHAWLAHHHLYILVGSDDLPGYEEIVRDMLGVFPVVDGPVREVPSCVETGAIMDRTVSPSTMEALRDQATFHTHFEGNRPSGLWASFHDQHPLALAGLRRHEIIHTVDGVRLTRRRDFEPVLARMTRAGRMELVVSRARVRHARCIRLTIDPMAAAPAPPPP
jgi:hypothetical protein